MDIFIDENIPFLAEALRNSEEHGFALKRFSGRSLTRKALQNCLALCVRSTTRVDADLVQHTSVRFVGTATSGSEHIDLDFLREQGVFFRDARGCNANSVAEYVVFAMLLWAEKRGFIEHGVALRGKTLGIIGLGHIGKRVAVLSERLGMHVIGYDPPLLEISTTIQSGMLTMKNTTASSLHELMSKADCVTNHVPLTHTGKYATAGMLDEDILSHLRPEALFIHASRGGVVVERVLENALKEKGLFAALDVWEGEPLVNAALAKRCMLATPHIGGYSYEGKVNGSVIMARELERFITKVVGKPFTVDWSIFERALEHETLPHLNYSNQAQMLHELRISRALEQDTASLLAVLDSDKPREAFDNLRKNYPSSERREILV